MFDVTHRFPIPLVWPRLRMDLARVDAIAIHHTVTFYLSPNATVEDELNQITVIDMYHRSKGFEGFGYHFIAFPSGRAYYVVRLAQWGAHVGGENDHLYGIAVAGDFTDRIPGLPQREGAVGAIAFIYGYLGRRLPIRPHRAWNPPWGGTICPGNTWQDWVPGLIELVDGKEDDTMPDGHAPGELHVSHEERLEIHNNIRRTRDLRTDYNNLLKAVQALQKDTLASGDVIKVELVE